MSFKIAVTSGKGGTGKTTISTGLFYYLNKIRNIKVQLLDCDVEEPNCNIFLDSVLSSTVPVTLQIPEVDKSKCTYCGKCKDSCAFNAIVLLPSTQFIEIIPDICHACGACSYVCPEKAIIEKTTTIGEISKYTISDIENFTEGRIHVGSSLQTRVIKATLQHAANQGITIFDSPPGTSCPVVATVSTADYVIMVTEPTPYGLHDLKLMTETVRTLNKPYGVVINKAGLKFDKLYNFLMEEDIPLLAEIPFEKKYAKAYSVGKILLHEDPLLEESFKSMFEKIVNGKQAG
ncbi:MAG: ATP-binding protein [Bacteroidales bacterium]|nr:ATP-binding protein [Bacteroidales bacterium]